MLLKDVFIQLVYVERDLGVLFPI